MNYTPPFLTNELNDLLLSADKTAGIAIITVTADDYGKIISQIGGDSAVKWAQTNKFSAREGEVLCLPDENGGLLAVVLGTGKKSFDETWLLAGALPKKLPAGDYYFKQEFSKELTDKVALAWVLGAYRFVRYLSKADDNGLHRLCVPSCANVKQIINHGEAAYFVRDLINIPTCDMGTAQFANAARQLAQHHSAHYTCIKGDDLLIENFPLVHAVGRASVNKPRLIEINWGADDDLKVTLVGKGVCFDSGGLDLKSAAAMFGMKKDMAGAANILALAHMIIAARLKVKLRVIIPVIENSVSGNAYHPGDIFPSRKGLTVEIGNTDAEGRLILADALAYGDEDEPDIMIDMATLTGAARVALGPDIPAFYSTSDDFAAMIADAAQDQLDPAWRMPLWQPYCQWLKPQIADLRNTASKKFGGSIVAALFLSNFVDKAKIWGHFDIYDTNIEDLPARPEGGEAQGIRTIYQVIKQKSEGLAAN